jgi:hypothetical protein
MASNEWLSVKGRVYMEEKIKQLIELLELNSQVMSQVPSVLQRTQEALKLAIEIQNSHTYRKVTNHELNERYIKCECLKQNELRGIHKATWDRCPNCKGLGFYR